MRDNLRAAALRFAAFFVACIFGAFAVLAVFASLRFGPQQTYRAEFSDVTGLKEGNFVRIAGVEVGKVNKISINHNAVAVVDFSVDESVVLTDGNRASIRWADPIGGRYMELEEGAGGLTRIRPGGTIPLDHTTPALDLDTLIGGFRPLFRALDPQQVNALSGQLIAALQGQAGAVGSFLTQAATVTNALADRDDVIKQVIENLDAVLGSLGDHSDQLTKTVTTLSETVKVLADRKTDVSNAVAAVDAASKTVADLLVEARPPLKNTVHQADRTAGLVVADHEYVDDLLNTLPDAYKALARQGLYGDFFSFYLCDLILKFNGKGGQPVYVKVAGQDSGRCAPK